VPERPGLPRDTAVRLEAEGVGQTWA